MSDRRLVCISFCLVAALAVMSGCANEDYYCDDTGCFYCDGVGCREVEPPPRSDCRGDFECNPGETCTDLGCVATGCTEDAECSEGTVCRDGYCVAPTEPRPTPMPGDCETNADCDPDLVCFDGVCTPSTEPGGCTADADCTGGDLCADGECRPAGQVCRFNAECGEGRVCVNERCHASCAADPTMCPAGQECVADVCVDEGPTTSPECMANTDCGEANRICLDGTCHDGCADDSECGAEQYCYFGRCRVDDRPRHFCESDEDCMTGAVCRNYVCRSPCTEHAECPRFDVSLTFCHENVCATTNEATSDCAEAADCDAGQSCIDGICR